MNWNWLYVAATVLFKAAEVYITYAAAEEKQEESLVVIILAEVA